MEHKKTAAGIPVTSNAILLSGREWLAVGLFVSVVYIVVPSLWRQVEPFDPGPDYRIPYALSGDYWFFDRYARLAAASYDTLIIGDSVIWGQYVDRDGMLSHHLNELAGRPRFANLGLDGMHPAALAGLLEFYGKSISGTSVILHLNPLWMSSPKHDLQVKEEFRFNHPQLVPQFLPRIPCYREEISVKIGHIIEKNVPFRGWTNHLQVAYYGMDIPNWTIDHPYENPLSPLFRGLPDSGKQDRFEAISWTARGIRKQDFAWVDPGTSLQWRFFRRAVELLRARENRVFVLVGPFNEHLLAETSQEAYWNLIHGMEAWLEKNEVPYTIPPPLPSELYADASHPLSEGYAQLAQRLWRLELNR